MIFFIINNNYQRQDLLLNISGFKEDDLTVIEIPHTLEAYSYPILSKILIYKRTSKESLYHEILTYLSVTRKISSEVKPTKEDVLFLFTENEIINQYLVKLFNKAKAKVFLIEDGGLGTYVPFRTKRSGILTIKETIKKSIYNLLPGLYGLRIHKIGKVCFLWMSDSCFTGVCFYRKLSHLRNIPVHLVKHSISSGQIRSIDNRVVFLNEPIYQHYQTKESYIDGLEKILYYLDRKYDSVYFKFHPREKIEMREWIRNKLLNRYPHLKIIESNSPFEDLLDEYQPSILASYFATSLITLAERKIEPLYLYHLIPELAEQEIFKEMTVILNELKYNFLQSFSINENISNSEFLKTDDEKIMTLAELVNNFRS